MGTTVNWDIAIPVVFPDYAITVDARAIGIDELVNDWGVRRSVAQFSTRISFLGHAGVLFVKYTGLTKYFEFGRYSSFQGEVVNRRIPDCKMDSDGHPTEASLTDVLKKISKSAGHGTHIEAAYIVVRGGFSPMHNYAMKMMGQNSSPKRAKYSLLRNSCLHFMKNTVEASKVALPDVGFGYRPIAYMKKVQRWYPDLAYANAQLNIAALTSEVDYVPGWASEKSFWETIRSRDANRRYIKTTK